MMNELQVKKSNISQWVSSIRIPNRNISPNHSMARARDYEPRIIKIGLIGLLLVLLGIGGSLVLSYIVGNWIINRIEGRR